MNFNDMKKLNEYYQRKHTNVLSPSDEDMSLILFANDIEAPLISEDWDVTFFYDELLNQNLAFEIYNFKSISYPN